MIEPHLQSAWTHSLQRLGAVLVGSIFLGLALQQLWAVLAIALFAVLLWNCLRMRRLLAHLNTRRKLHDSRRAGVWGALERLLHRRQSQYLAHRQCLLEMLRAYHTAAMVLPDALVLVERESQQILWLNDAAAPILGLQHPADIGQNLMARLQPLQLADWFAQGPAAEPLIDIASPTSARMRINLRLIQYAPQLCLVLARDVSKMTRLEQTRRDFVANVSHELRTPLTVLHGYLDILDPNEHLDIAPLLTEMRIQTERMNQLVNDLLRLSRLEALDEINDEPVNMAHMLQAMGQIAEGLSQGRHRIHILQDCPHHLRGSPKELHSAFSNLVSNAVRYTPAGGQIDICFQQRPDGSAVFSVSDTGYGIAAAHLSRLTERFYRVSNSRSRETGGTGLGLSIVKHVLNLHQAHLDIRSEVGHGSTFACIFDASRLLPDAALTAHPSAVPEHDSDDAAHHQAHFESTNEHTRTDSTCHRPD